MQRIATCKIDPAVPCAKQTCRPLGRRSAQSYSKRTSLSRDAAFPHSMRRTPSMNISKNRASVQAKGDESDVTVNVGSKIPPKADDSPQSKSKSSKSGFTVFGLQPSPELLSISMGTKSTLCVNNFACNCSANLESTCPVALQCTLSRAYLDLRD